jgi:hypothetical protein
MDLTSTVLMTKVWTTDIRLTRMKSLEQAPFVFRVLLALLHFQATCKVDAILILVGSKVLFLKWVLFQLLAYRLKWALRRLSVPSKEI